MVAIAPAADARKILTVKKAAAVANSCKQIFMKISKKLCVLAVLGVLLLGACYAKINMPQESDMTDEEIATMNSVYLDYSPDKFSELNGSQKFVLFFHAPWCPTCRALEATIKNNLEPLKNAIILKADYDSEVELKKQYGIRIQTSVVFINADGSVEKLKVNPSVKEIAEFFS